MKVLRHRNLFGLLFAVLLALPLLSVAARCVYVSANKNAKDSYSGDTTYEINYKYQSNEVNSAEDLVDGNIYKITINNSWVNTAISQNYGYLNITGDILRTYNAYAEGFNDSYLDELYFNDNDNLPVINFAGISFYLASYDNEFNIMFFSPSNNDYVASFIVPSNNFIFEFDILLINHGIEFDFTNMVGINDFISYSDYNEIESVNIDNTGTLDNAFEYSIKSITDDDNLGRINFFTWFEDMFLDSSNSANNLYIHFANWYMNYALLISLVYILFLVLMWFVNFVRKLLDRGMSFGEGSY